VITVLYFAVVYNQLTEANGLAYSNMNNISASINSLMSEPLFTAFCSLLIFVIVMKFMQAFVYIVFESKQDSIVSRIIFFQNSLIALIGVYLFIRLNPFFFALGQDWGWTILVIGCMFLGLGVLNKLFMPFCRAAGWVEKYIVDSAANIVELAVRGFSFVCCKLQTGNFQLYIIYSLSGLVTILGFVLIFYLVLIKL
jgi:hypothetical protein